MMTRKSQKSSLWMDSKHMKIAAIFKDNMILQRDKKVRVFGWSEIADTLTISIDGVEVTADVAPSDNDLSDASLSEDNFLLDNGGRIYDWLIELPPHPAGGPYDMTITSEKTGETKVISGVLFGEVWLNTGQSNIEFCLRDARGGLEEISKASFPEIRYYTAPNYPMVDDTLSRLEEGTEWKSLDRGLYSTDKEAADSFGDISAIGYYYSVMLYKKLGVPVGVIDCYKGGTSISCWLERNTLERIPEGRVYLDEYDSVVAGQTDEEYSQIIDDFNKKNAEHDRIVAELLKVNPNATPADIYEAAGRYSWPPPLGRTSEFRPCGLVESMLKRVAPYTVMGAVYYQGEEDALRNYNILKSQRGTNDFYKNLLVAFIQDLRRLFINEDMPFIDIQLTQFLEWGTEDLRDWAYLREAQDAAINESGLHNTYLIPLIDLGEFDNVHPLDKKTPGERVGRVMLSLYGEEAPHYPKVVSVTKSTQGIKLEVENATSGLITIENELLDLRQELTGTTTGTTGLHNSTHVFGFEVLVENESAFTSDVQGDSFCEKLVWKVPDEVILDGNLIVVKDSKEIFGVSYGFFNYGKVNLYNREGLPLSQFRVSLSDEL